MHKSAPPFLVRYLPPASASRPHITVTWAQSLDSKIAGKAGARVILSGPESMTMTHWLRVMHDAILVGINTIILDDPRLKAQLVPQDDPTLFPPQPLILDPSLRFPLTSRILSEWNDRESKPEIVQQPWIICGDQVPEARVKEVEQAGARVILVPVDTNGRISPNSLPGILRTLGLRSVMVEGGSAILSSFLHAPNREDGSPLVDNVVITVAPMFIGEGIGVIPEGEGDVMPILKFQHTETMGKDAVMICTVKAHPR